MTMSESLMATDIRVSLPAHFKAGILNFRDAALVYTNRIYGVDSNNLKPQSLTTSCLPPFALAEALLLVLVLVFVGWDVNIVTPFHRNPRKGLSYGRGAFLHLLVAREHPILSLLHLRRLIPGNHISAILRSFDSATSFRVLGSKIEIWFGELVTKLVGVPYRVKKVS
jgi:hypothetical protein